MFLMSIIFLVYYFHRASTVLILYLFNYLELVRIYILYD